MQPLYRFKTPPAKAVENTSKIKCSKVKQWNLCIVATSWDPTDTELAAIERWPDSFYRIIRSYSYCAQAHYIVIQWNTVATPRDWLLKKGGLI